MTLHAAKGLEFPSVFMIAFEHDILPHERSVREGYEEEERRLAFVGITRAQEDLVISYARKRTFQGRTTMRSPSPFLRELDADSLQREDIVEAVMDHEGAMDFDESQETYLEEPTIQILRGSSEPSPSDRYQRGMLVEHPRYGRGQILQLEGVGSDRKATIFFPTVGQKRFVLSMAPLQPVQSP
jgi:DNA helicase-2/ATP-dependent DNA helicase PcrA